jgi:hypothetical protein
MDIASYDSRLLLEHWTMICWALWTARNKFVFELTQQHPSQVLNTALVLLQDYQTYTSHHLYGNGTVIST